MLCGVVPGITLLNAAARGIGVGTAVGTMLGTVIHSLLQDSEGW